MNMHQLRGRLLQWRGAIRVSWSARTGNERLERAGRRDRALGIIEHRHGLLRAAIARQQRRLAQHMH